MLTELHPLTQQPNTPPSQIAQQTGRITVNTPGPGFLDVTAEIVRWLKDCSTHTGVLTVFIRHTSASLVIQENADPDVQYDLLSALEKLAPENANYRHSLEGPDDMPAHIKAMVTNTSLTIPVENGRLMLGTWQGIYVVEHRSMPHARELSFNFTGSFNSA